MTMTFNSSYPRSDSYRNLWHANVVSAAGPAITLLQAVVFYRLLKNTGNVSLFPFLFTAFYMRLLAAFMNMISLNDEGRISKDLGLGVYTLPVIITVILFYLVYDIVKTGRFSTKFIMLNILLVMCFSSVIILADQALELAIL